MPQKIIFELAIEDANVAVRLEQMRAALKEINKELKAATPGSDAFNALAVEAQQTKDIIGQLTEAQKQLKKEFAATQVPTDSLAGLRLEYSSLIAQVTKLSKAERETKVGQDLIKNAAGVKDQINEIQESVGNFTGSVGNYKNGILAAFDTLQQFGGSLGAQAGLLAAARQGFDLVSQGAEKFAGAFSEGIDKLQEGVAGVRDYLNSLKETKKVNDDAAKSANDVGDAVEGAAESGAQAGEGLAESAKGATLFGRAGTALKGVLASLGIGLIILAITTLISIFKQFSPVIDFVEQVVAGLSAIFDVLVQRAIKVYEAIGKFFTGDFNGAFNGIADAASGLTGALIDAASAAAQLQKEFQDLEDAQKDFALQNAKAEASIAKLTVSLKDRTKSDKERLRIADEITKQERAILKTKTDLTDAEIELERRKLTQSGQITKEQSEQIAKGDFELARQLEDSFKLKADQTDRIRDLLVQQAQNEGESARFLETINNRRNAILDAAAQKREANSKKAQEAIEKENKALEAQAARLIELQKSIRDLDAQTISNDFDRQQTEIENKRADALDKLIQQREALNKKIRESGKETANDKTESALISEQTASIVAATQQQLDAVGRARREAFEAAQNELKTLSGELFNLNKDNALALVEVENNILNAGFASQTNSLRITLNERKKALQDQLLNGQISQKEFETQSATAQQQFNAAAAKLERERYDKSVELSNALRSAKIAAARGTLSAELEAIRQALEADIAALKERAKAEGIDATDLIAARELAAVEKRKKAYTDYANTVNEASKGVVQTELEGKAAIDAADQAAFEAKMKRLEDEKDRRKKLRDFIIDQAGTISRALIDIEKLRLQEETDASLGKLATEYEQRKAAAAGNAVQLAALDAEYNKKKEAIEKDAAKKRKQIAIKEAIIQGALAVVKALPNIFLSIAAGIAAAAQIAVISNQKFARGGVVGLKSGMFGGKPHSAGGTKGYFSDGTQVEVEKDERFIILNRRASAAIARYSDLNYQFGGRKFAAGGALDFVPQISSPGASGTQQIVVVANAEFSEDQISKIAAEIARQTGAGTKTAIADGLNDNNRRSEREKALQTNRAA